MICAVCDRGASLFALVDGYEYSECVHCGSIAIDRTSMAAIDAGEFIRDYSAEYWAVEAEAARERSWGASLARCAEVMLYARLSIERFIDIGAGPGFLLDALSEFMPEASGRFFGVERFPPREHTSHPGYKVGELSDLEGTFQAGCCIEVIEHLTPVMLRRLARDLAARSEKGSIFIFNSGNPDYVRHENPKYLDPLLRGHIVSWGLPALRAVFEPEGFHIGPIRGKSFAFIAEFGGEPSDYENRIWSPSPENVKLLTKSGKGSIMYLLGLETARAYR